MTRNRSLALTASRPLIEAARLFRALAQWQGTRRSRAALARLDAHLLRDIGLDPARARDEADRPFWDA